MGTTTALALLDRLSQSIGDYIAKVVTTNIAANVAITSTHLKEYDGGNDNAFKDYWIYIASQNNNDKERKIQLYYTANATALVYGANLASDTNIADIRVSRYSYTDKLRAINDAVREVFPTLYRPVVNTALITEINTYEYTLPANLASGELNKVLMQENVTNTIANQSWGLVYGWRILDDGSTKKFRLPFNPTNAIAFRLEGIAPFSTLAGPSNSVETSEERQLSLLTAYAKYKLYQSYEQPVSAQDTSKNESQSARAYAEYLRLKASAGMMKPAGTMHLGGV